MYALRGHQVVAGCIILIGNIAEKHAFGNLAVGGIKVAGGVVGRLGLARKGGARGRTRGIDYRFGQAPM